MDIADIQDYFEFTIKKHETLTEILLYKLIPIKLKTGYKLKLLSSETMKLLGSTKKDVD